MVDIFESVPNFSEGRRGEVIDAISATARGAYHLDTDSDPDHNRVVVSLAGPRPKVVATLLAAIAASVDRIDLRGHVGVHPRVGAADVVPIVPLGEASLDTAREIAHELGQMVWSDLKVPVYFYGHGESRTLADIRAGRATMSLGGPDHHPTAGAVSIGARRPLVAFNLILHDIDIAGARALARSIRESGAGLRGVQALAFELPGRKVQLSMNLFRIDETTPTDVIAELTRRGVGIGAEQIVGLSPAVAANTAAGGRLLEGRLASAAASAGAEACESVGDEEHVALAGRLRKEADELAALPAEQDAILAGAERAAALIPVLRAAGVLDDEREALLKIAARGLGAAVWPATRAIYRARFEALNARISPA